ncbi:unnamed protein product [Linum trigynum]|uniref:Uncharacterized protein n=1 Tax=Linum trigynum TaxID=586398 RepID=A0AAV2FYS6_9ROSI
MGAFRLISIISYRRTIIALSSPAAQVSVISQLLGIRSFTSQIAPQEEKDGPSFPVSYLMTSLGFSADGAKYSSRCLNFQTAEKPDAVVNLLRSHGFSSTQIAKCIKGYPSVLVLDPERIVRPKLDFLLSLGIPSPELNKVVSSNPYLLIMSLEKCLIPRCNFLKEVLARDDEFVRVLKRSQRCFVGNIQNNVVRNLALLRNLGVSKNAIAYLVSNFPHVAFKVHSDFAKRVELAKEFGCDPLKWNFASAIRVFSSVKKSSWEKRLQVYGRWGWSKDLIMLAFKIFPQCMCNSDEKIMQTMDFLVNKLGWESEAAAKFPNIFSLSFEKRVVPRCSVLQLLRLRGLIDDMPCLSTFLCPAEKRFKEKFVVEYPDDIQAELLDLYERRVNVVDFRTMAVEDVKSRS